MFSERLLSIFALMSEHERSGADGALLCTVAKEITGVSAASVALTSDVTSLIGFCSSNGMAGALVDLETKVGEGPSSQAIETDSVASCVDLTTDARWILFTPEAMALGARSVSAIPIRIGVIRYGALCLYGVEAGELNDEQLVDAHLMASVVGRGILAMQAGAKLETLSEDLQREGAFDFSVHQAAGMVAVQASISISSALISLRMHAFAISEALADVASRIIARRLHFDAGRQEWIES